MILTNIFLGVIVIILILIGIEISKVRRHFGQELGNISENIFLTLQLFDSLDDEEVVIDEENILLDDLKDGRFFTLDGELHLRIRDDNADGIYVAADLGHIPSKTSMVWLDHLTIVTARHWQAP